MVYLSSPSGHSMVLRNRMCPAGGENSKADPRRRHRIPYSRTRPSCLWPASQRGTHTLFCRMPTIWEHIVLLTLFPFPTDTYYFATYV